jgi:arsenate reductase (glutaredoxin)
LFCHDAATQLSPADSRNLLLIWEAWEPLGFRLFPWTLLLGTSWGLGLSRSTFIFQLPDFVLAALTPTMTTVYTYAKCSTCRDAVKWLRAREVKFVEKPIYENPPGVAELRRMLAYQDGNLRRLFNTSGIEYRALGLATKLPMMTQDDAFRLLSTNGRLVKRPFVLGDSFGLVGFDPAAWSEVFH